MSLIRAEAVERTFGSGPAAVHALRGITLELRPGGLTVLKGRSGSGKTTLLNLLGGLDRPTRGRVLMDGQDLAQLSRRALTQLRLRRIGFVFQSFGLLPLLSAAENVELPLRIAGLPPAVRAERAKQWLDFVGLKERMAHRPYELSGGEQQRTALARALAAEPALILADEPTSAVDSRIAAQVLQLLHRITRETGVAICLTTHDPSAMEVADVVYELADGSLVHKE